ncbi:MAG: hypothetical protein E7496_10735 [Ruminococcus sp.]|nr:hypothetical protein [Ruminococcus sp.]
MKFIHDYEAYCKHLETHLKKYHLTLFPTAQKFIEDNYTVFYHGQYAVMINSFLDDYNQIKLLMNGKSLSAISEKLSADIGEMIFPAVRVYIYHTLIRFIFISESGKFYLDNGQYLDDDYHRIIDGIFSETLKIPILVCDRILTSLQRHGWNQNRKLDISEIRKQYHLWKYEMFPSAVAFFEEIPCSEYHSWFESEGYRDILIKPANICDKRIAENYLCIGYGCERAFFIGESGRFYARIFSSLLEFPTMYEFFTWAFEY